MKLIILFVAATFFRPAENIPGTTWLTDFEKAKITATQSNRFILLNFSGSDWCAPCKRLKDEFFSTDIFTKFAADNLVLANADFPRLRKNQLEKTQAQQNEALAEKYNPAGEFPLTILISSSGKLLKQWKGLPVMTTEQFVQDIKNTYEKQN
jgi:thiol-disulfide isomerase/thioredoxin